ncbi:MAG TPA: hypothetical protein VGV68_05295, partial [Terriglobia bacterium]|nr:hypothetical protein [Terriglobia bacterium]
MLYPAELHAHGRANHDNDGGGGKSNVWKAVSRGGFTPPEEWRGEPAVTKNHFAQRPDHRSSLLKSDFPRVPLISNLELFRS